MYIDDLYFLKLELTFGEMIYLMIETGEGFTGTFQGGYTGSTFLFNNFSNGKQQTIQLSKLQQLERVNTPRA